MMKQDETYSFRHIHIPDYMMDGLLRYINHGINPGGFLLAVLKNNLSDACAKADDINLSNLPAYVAFLYNKAPASCWGDSERVARWVTTGGRYGGPSTQTMEDEVYRG